VAEAEPAPKVNQTAAAAEIKPESNKTLSESNSTKNSEVNQTNLVEKIKPETSITVNAVETSGNKTNTTQA